MADTSAQLLEQVPPSWVRGHGLRAGPAALVRSGRRQGIRIHVPTSGPKFAALASPQAGAREQEGDAPAGVRVSAPRDCTFFSDSAY